MKKVVLGFLILVGGVLVSPGVSLADPDSDAREAVRLSGDGGGDGPGARLAEPFTGSVEIDTTDEGPDIARDLTVTVEGFDDYTNVSATVTVTDGDALLSVDIGETAVDFNFGYDDWTDVTSIGFHGSREDVVAVLADGITLTPSAGDVEITASVTEYVEDVFYSAESGSYYQQGSGATDWSDALDKAADETLYGLSGYLATLTTEAENDFVANYVDAEDVWIAASDTETEGTWKWMAGPEDGDSFWIAPCSPDYVGGDGMPDAEEDPCGGAAGDEIYDYGSETNDLAVDFSSWDFSEPNNADFDNGGEDYAVTNWGGATGYWNDLAGVNGGEDGNYLIEYSGDANVPAASDVYSLSVSDGGGGDSEEFFIRNEYVEVGGRINGTFGSEGPQPDETWHSNDVGDRIGFRSDREKDGWGVGIDDGDFFLPGDPYEGWGLQVADNSPVYNNYEDTGIDGTMSQVDDVTATWESSSAVNGIDVSQTYSVPEDGGQYLNVEVTLSNTTDSALDVYYGRGVDPDNCVYRQENVEWDGSMSTCADSMSSYSTLNSVVSQGVDGDSGSVVSATADDGSYIDLRTTESTSVVGSDPSWDYGAMGDGAVSLADLYAIPTTYTEADPYEGAIVNAVGESQFVDGAVYLVVKKSIPAGESVTFTVQYVLSQSEADVIDGGGGDGPGDFSVPELSFDSPAYFNLDSLNGEILYSFGIGGDEVGSGEYCSDDNASIGLTSEKVLVMCDGDESHPQSIVSADVGTLLNPSTDQYSSSWDLVSDLKTGDAYGLVWDVGYEAAALRPLDADGVAPSDDSEDIELSYADGAAPHLVQDEGCLIAGNGYGVFGVWNVCEGQLWTIDLATASIEYSNAAGSLLAGDVTEEDGPIWMYDGFGLSLNDFEGGSWAITGVMETNGSDHSFVIPAINDDGMERAVERGSIGKSAWALVRFDPMSTGVAEELLDWRDSGFFDSTNYEYADDVWSDQLDFYKFIYSPETDAWYAHIECYQEWCKSSTPAGSDEDCGSSDGGEVGANDEWFGDGIAPIRAIQGDSTLVFKPWSVAFDSDGCAYVASTETYVGTVAFAADANGDVEPVKSLLDSGIGDIAFDTHGRLYGMNDGEDTLYVFAGAEVDGWSQSDLVKSMDLAGPASDWWLVNLDSENNTYIANYNAGEVAMFGEGWDEESAPERTAVGMPEGLLCAMHVDSEDNLYVATCASGDEQSAVYMYAAGWGDGDGPTKILQGDSTGLSAQIYGMTVDSLGNLYVSNFDSSSITMYAAGWASGDTAPTKTLAGESTNLSHPAGIDFDAMGDLYVADYGANAVWVFDGPALGDSCDRCTGAGRHHGGGGGGSSDPGTETPGVEPTVVTAAGGRELLPGTMQPTSPITRSDGSLPTVAFGAVEATADGVADPVTLAQGANGEWSISGPGMSLRIDASPGAAPTITDDESLAVSGSNLEPGSLVDVWAFSTPTFLGSFTVGSDGAFRGAVTLPASLPAGDHTLQINGTSADGRVRSVNVGVRVVDSNFTLPKTGGNDMVAIVALWLIAAGVFVMATRRRRVIG